MLERELNPAEERARMAEALALTRQAIALADHYAPTTHSYLKLAETILGAMVRSTD
jgi:hypothetical protein